MEREELKSINGKLDNVIKEMKRLDIKIMGISDTKWPEKNKLVTANGSVLYHSGSEVGAERYGVLNAETAKAVKKFVPLSSMLVSFESKPCNINIIQVYAPTADKPQEQMEDNTYLNTIPNTDRTATPR